MQTPARFIARGVLMAVAALALAGCGGGVYVTAYGPPPEISLAASTNQTVLGQPIRLIGAVSSSNGMDYVDFYRIDPTQDTRLGTVYGPPVQFDTSIPLNAGYSVSYYARACDVAGYCTNSQVVTVSVL